MQMILTVLLAGLATYHETYNRPISMAAAASLATAPKYILFPEQRAKKVSPRSWLYPPDGILCFPSSVLLFSEIVIIYSVNRSGTLSITITSRWARVT